MPENRQGLEERVAEALRPIIEEVVGFPYAGCTQDDDRENDEFMLRLARAALAALADGAEEGLTHEQIADRIGEAAEWASSALMLRPEEQPSGQVAAYLERITTRLDLLVGAIHPEAPAANREHALSRLADRERTTKGA